jgi:hypothetical protein
MYNKKKSQGKRKPYQKRNETPRDTSTTREQPEKPQDRLQPKENGDERDSRKSEFNSPEWYAASPQLLKDAASLAFSEPLGSNYILSNNASGSWVGSLTDRVPGVMTLTYAPSIGVANAGSDSINIAARNIYSFVRYANAGHINYNSPDLMMYLLAMDQIYSFYAWMVRTYGALSVYSIKNRYLPDTVVRAMNADAVDLRKNLANFRYYINVFAVKAGSLCVPATMSYMARHMWMNSNVFADSLSLKSQLYVFNPDGFWQYTPIAESTGGNLTYKTFTPVSLGLFTLTDIMTFGDALLGAVISDEDCGIMSGDILKAFGLGNLVQLGQVPENYAVIPAYVPEVLTQIHNATINGTPYTQTGVSTFNVSQSNDLITFNPVTQTTTGMNIDNKLFDMPMDAPEAADVMVASRLTVLPKDTTYNGVTLKWHSTFLDMGTEIITRGDILRLNTDGSIGTPLTFGNVLNISSSTVTSTDVELIAALEKFDWHPGLYIATGSGGQPVALTLYDIMEDLTNYTVIAKSDLTKMHTTAVLSEFAVPLMGSAAMRGNSTTKV